MSVEKITGRVLIDTNVLIYATLVGDHRHLAALAVLELRLRPDIEMFVSVQNLAEMFPNLTGPKNHPPDTPQIARDKIRSISGLQGITVLPLTLEGVLNALDLCVEGQIARQHYFDRQLIALMMRENIPTIISENNRDFIGIEGIKTINPFS